MSIFEEYGAFNFAFFAVFCFTLKVTVTKVADDPDQTDRRTMHMKSETLILLKNKTNILDSDLP